MAAMCADLATPPATASASASGAAVATAVVSDSSSNLTTTTTATSSAVGVTPVSEVCANLLANGSVTCDDTHSELETRREGLLRRRRLQLKRKRVQLIETATQLFNIQRDEPLGYHCFSKRASVELVQFMQSQSLSSNVVSQVSKALFNNMESKTTATSMAMVSPLTPPPSTDTSDDVKVELASIDIAQHVPSSPLSSASPRPTTTAIPSRLKRSSTFKHFIDSTMNPIRTGPKLAPMLKTKQETNAEVLNASSSLFTTSTHIPEGFVLRRTLDLTRAGLLWSKRLPKVCERPRQETHWDSTLLEMQWLAVDFKQEKMWKKAAAKVLAYSAKEFVRNWEARKTRKREQMERLERKRAAFLASKVEHFWTEAWLEQSMGQLCSSRGVSKPYLSNMQRHLAVSCRDSGVEEDEEGRDSSCDEDSTVLENGIYYSEDEEGGSPLLQEYLLDDESTISEQERFERESGTAIGMVQELNELAFDLKRPVEELLSLSCVNRDEKLEQDESYPITRCISDLSLDSLESLLDEDVEEHVVRVPLSKRKRKLYDDFLATATVTDPSSLNHASLEGVITNLEKICNQSSSFDEADSNESFRHWEAVNSATAMPSVVTNCRVHRAFTTILEYDPFNHFDPNSFNLVFLTHESSLTVISSACIRAFCASQKLMMSLLDPSSKTNSQTPRAPAGRFVLEIQPTFLSGPTTSTNVSQSVALASGNRHRPAVSLTSHMVPTEVLTKHGVSSRGETSSNTTTSTQYAFHNDSLEVISRFNERRCKGMPLYGQDLLSTLTIVDSVRPLTIPSRGVGYVNCLNASSENRSRISRQEYKLKTSTLERLIHCSNNVCEQASMYTLPVRHVALLRHWNEFLALEERRLMPDLSVLATTYSLPIRGPQCSMSKSIFAKSDQDGESKASKKLEAIYKLLLEIKSKKSEKAVLLCHNRTLFNDILSYFNKKRLDSIGLNTSLPKEAQLRQVSKFISSQRIGLCLVALESNWSTDLIRMLTGVKHLLIVDGFSQGDNFMHSQWRRLSRPLHIHRFAYEDTIETASLYLTKDCPSSMDKNVFSNLEREILAKLHRLGTTNGLIGVSEGNSSKYNHALHGPWTLGSECAPIPWPHCNGSTPMMSSLSDESSKLPNVHQEEDMEELFNVPLPLRRYRQAKLDSIDLPLDCNISDEPLIDEGWEASFFEKELELERELLFFERQCQLSYYSKEATKSWCDRLGSEMPVFTPPKPTPVNLGYDENLLKVEPHLGLLYKGTIMAESELPAVHVSKNDQLALHIRLSSKRSAGDAGMKDRSLSPKNKMRREDSSASHVPPSLFNRNMSTNSLSKMRRTDKLSHANRSLNSSRPFQLSMSNIGGTSGFPLGSNNPPASLAGLLHPLPRPQVEQENVVEWLIQEDWALLQSVRECQELPLSLHVVSPAHTVNWDLVSDMVNSVSRVFRSARQCRHRYENIIVPREEGRILLSVSQVPNLDSLVSSVSSNNEKSSPKQKKLPKSLAKATGFTNFNSFSNKHGSTNSGRGNRTAQLVNKDKSASWAKLFVNRFESIKAVANKRTPTTKPILVNPTQNSASKHRDFLTECGIDYEEPLGPVSVARNRAERIQKEKQKTLIQQQQVLQSQNSSSQTVSNGQLLQTNRVGSGGNVAAAAGIAQSQHQNVVVGIRPQPNASSGTVTTSIPVSAAAAAGISHPAAQQVIVQGTGPGGLTRLQVQPHPHTGQIVLPSSPAGSVQDIAARTVAAARAAAVAGSTASSSVVLTNPQSSVANVVSIGNLTPSQFQVAQKLVNQSSQGARGIIASKTLTPAQINQLKQQALLRKQQEQQQQAQTVQVTSQQQQAQSQQTAISTSSGVVSSSLVQKAAGRLNQSGQTVVQSQSSQQPQPVGQQRLSLTVPAGGSIPAAVVSAGAVPGTVTVVTQAGQAPHKTTTHVIRQLSSGTTGKSFRNLTDSEIKLLLAKQQQQQQLGATAVSSTTGKLTSIQVPAGQQGNLQQILSQAGIQLHSTVVTGGSGGAGAGQQLATLVKTVPSGHQMGGNGAQSVTIPIQGLPANVKATLQRGSGGQQQQVTAAASPQQMQLIQRHLLQQRAAASAKVVATSSVSGSNTPQKVTFGTASGKVPTQLIVSAGSLASASPVSTSKVTTGPSTASVTVEQFQQLVKSAGGSGQQQQQFNTIPHALLTKQNSNATGLQQQQPGSHQQTVQARVIPINNSSHQSGSRTQQIQVVAAPANSNPAVVAAALAGRQFGNNAGQQQGTTNVTTNASNVKQTQSSTITQQQLLNQLGYGQPISVAVRNASKPSSSSEGSSSQGSDSVVVSSGSNPSYNSTAGSTSNNNASSKATVTTTAVATASVVSSSTSTAPSPTVNTK